MPNFYMLVGLSGSFKSSYQFDEEIVKISSDSLRKELFGDENDQTHNAEIFNELHKRVVLNLKNGKNVVYDATNLSARRRIAFLNSIRHINCKKECIVLATPFEECVKRDAERARTVGREVILKQMKRFQMPQYDEGWDIIFVKQYCERIKLYTLYNYAYHIEHDNPHHLESIGKHLYMTETYLKNNGISLTSPLIQAAKFHDIGKLYTKNFCNSKGEKTKEAHYYSHEKVSSYLYLTSEYFSRTRFCFKTIWLIENHMRPYYSGYEKWKSTQNPEWVKDLEILHLADQEARITE